MRNELAECRDGRGVRGLAPGPRGTHSVLHAAAWHTHAVGLFPCRMHAIT